MKHSIQKLKYLLIAFIVLVVSCSKDDINGDNNNIGKGGSLARFIIVNNNLYVVDQQTLITYEIADEDIKKVDEKEIGFNIETIFNMGDHLLIGSQDAMYIYDISNPNKPNYTSSARHLRACDPVVANTKNAFVTVRTSVTTSESCGGNINALLVYDINDISYPKLINTIALKNPRGLALHNEVLYVCDGNDGIKIFNTNEITNNSTTIKGSIYEDGIIYTDCIIHNNYLFIKIDTGFKIYDISDPFSPIAKGAIAI